MTVENIVSMLEETGLDVAYYQYPEGEAPALPYLIYYFPKSSDMYADGINYAGKQVLDIELYTEKKEFNIENTLETKLKQNGLAFYKEERYINSERMYQVIYEMEAIING